MFSSTPWWMWYKCTKDWQTVGNWDDALVFAHAQRVTVRQPQTNPFDYATIHPWYLACLFFFFFFWCVYKAINIVTHTCPNTNIDQVFSTGKRQVRHSLCSMIYWLSTCWAHHSTRIPGFSFVYWEKEGKKKEIKEAKILSVLIEQCSSFGTALGD